MLLPDSPYAEPLQRAGASLCAASARRRRVGARRRLSLQLLPFTALPSSFAPSRARPLETPISCRRRCLRGWRFGVGFIAALGL